MKTRIASILSAALAVGSLSLLLGAMASEPRLGQTVPDSVAATLRGGDTCYNPEQNTCPDKGSCTARSILVFTGTGDYKAKGDDGYCGGSLGCAPYSVDKQKCGAE